jgi:prepilin-type N-terminal cleavage/methylation domain-containing protein|uniref:type II secretion system protein n=1 Tax=Prosthecobacter sp. TaxID=1965333 RepID=UPI003784781A
MKVSNILATRLARRTNNKGLTLIELLVVLVILIALAGILIPQLPNMLTRAHTAAASTNIPEANKRIQEFEQIYFKQPANFDNLVNGVALVDYLPGSTGLTAAALTAGTRGALFNAGITSLAGLYDTAANLETAGGTPTINPYDGAADLNLSAGTPSVAFATEATVEALLRQDAGANDAYVALGIGQRSELIGRTTNEAPYHFGDVAGSGPDAVYARYLAIYKVANDGTALDKAIFIGVLAMHDDGLANAGDHVSEFFEANQL